MSDEVQLSDETVVELKRAGFDEEKVAQIKQALADGNYPLDPKRIAEGFTEIEKLQKPSGMQSTQLLKTLNSAKRLESLLTEEFEALKSQNLEFFEALQAEKLKNFRSPSRFGFHWQEA